MPDQKNKAKQAKDDAPSAESNGSWTVLDAAVLSGVQFVGWCNDTTNQNWRDRLVAMLDAQDLSIMALSSIATREGPAFANQVFRLNAAGALECNTDELYMLARLSGLKNLVKKRVEVLFRLGAMYAIGDTDGHPAPVTINSKVYSELARRYAAPRNGR